MSDNRFGLAVFILLMLFPAISTPGAAQTVTLRGFVTDESDGAALEGANVSLLDRDQFLRGAVTNAAGYYQLSGIRPGSYIVRISYVGYVAHVDTLDLGPESPVTISARLSPGETLDEVVIQSEGGAARLIAGQQQVRPADLERIPTPDPGGDLATYLQTLPGVVTLGDRGGQLYIRGGTPSQNLVLLDGSMIYQPFHIIGFFSAFPQDLISNVNVFAGGYGARYNGKLSSVIDVTMRSGNMQSVEGAASAGPFLASLRMEGPIRKGRLSWLGSVRTSVIEDTAPTLLGQNLPLKFSDVVLKIQQTDIENRRCSLTGVHTYDRGRINPDADRTEVFQWQNAVLAGRCVGFAPGSSVFIEANSGFSYVSNSVGDVSLPEREADAFLFNTDVHWTYPTGTSEIMGGLHIQIEGGSYRLEEQYQGIRDDKDYQVATGIYLGAKTKLGPRLDFEPSVSLTYPLSYTPSVEPRLRLAWHPWGTDAQVLTGAVGLYRQTIQGINDERDVGSVFTLWIPAPVKGARSSAIHALLGWQQQVGAFNFVAEGYYKQVYNLPVPIWSVIARFTTSLTLADGDIYGMDTRVEFQRRHIYAYLGYGYSWTKYTTAQDNFGLWFDEPIQSYHPPHDRRHQINAVVALNTGKFKASLRWQFGSGLPYTRSIGTDSFIRFVNLPDVRRTYGNPRFLFEKPYQGRLPAYHRLDVSVEYGFDFPSADVTVQAGAINMYDRRNLFYFDLFLFRRVDQLSFLPFVSLLVEVNR